MKTVRLSGGVVAEVIPAYALPVSEFYGEEFAALCIEAPDEVTQGWVYNAAVGRFSPPAPPAPMTMTTEEAMLDMLADHEYRLSLAELGGQT